MPKPTLYFVTCHYTNSRGSNTSCEFPLVLSPLEDYAETIKTVKKVMNQEHPGWDDREYELFFTPIKFAHGPNGIFQVNLGEPSKRKVPESKLVKITAGEPATVSVGEVTYMVERPSLAPDDARNTGEKVQVRLQLTVV